MRNEPPRPSRVTRWVLGRLLGEAELRSLLSELAELWQGRRERYGQASADRWYGRQLRRFPVWLISERARRRVRGGSAPGQGVPPDREIDGVLAGLVSDARHAARGWVRSPVMALTIVATIGLGIGASTAMFAVIRVVLLHPLPYAGAERLERIYHALRTNRWNLSVADWQAMESQRTQYDGMAAYMTSEQTLTGDGAPERVRVRAVTAGWFDLLGLRAARGRTFRTADGEYGAPGTVILSWGFWQRHYGAEASAVGRSIRLDGEDYTIVGVLQREVGPFEERMDVFPALRFAPPTRRGPFLLTVVGRLRADVSPAAAHAELRAIDARIDPIWQSGAHDPTDTWGAMPLDEFVIGRFRTILLVLAVAVGLVLLVSSTNAAGLLTARGMQRRMELSTRAALGASGGRLIRLLMVESVLLAGGGALFGLGFAAATVRAIRAAGPDLLPRAGFITLDATVLGFAFLLAAASMIVFGLIPALQLVASQRGVAGSLRSAGRTMTGDASAQMMRRGLVAAQFAIAVPLLAGAALLGSSFARLQRVDPGFEGEGVLTVHIARPTTAEETPEQQRAFWDRLLERVNALPGVAAAGLNTSRPPTGANNINNFDPIDRPTPPGESEPTAVWLIASPGYFDALGIRLASGRMFNAFDANDTLTTFALVDRTWANTIYPGENPIGKRLYEGGCRAAGCSIVEVVGIVDDVRYLGLDDSQGGASVGSVYVPQSQWIASSTNLFVRTSGDPLQLLAPIRSIVADLDPTIPLSDIATARELVDRALASPRNLAAVVAAFALVALILAVIGIYGVMNYFVHEHRKDIGVRLALGGRPVQVRRLILGRGLRPVLLGTVAGLATTFAVTRFMTRLLYDVSPSDPATIGSVALILLATAVAACWMPAHQAARLDPAETLRVE